MKSDKQNGQQESTGKQSAAERLNLPQTWDGSEMMLGMLPQTPPSLRQKQALRWQQTVGNQTAQRHLLQRQTAPATPATGGTPAPAVDPNLPRFSFARAENQGTQFDTVYTPVGPTPDVGTLEINLWLHITYKNFERAMMRQEPYRNHRFTPAQLADFNWTDEEKATFELGMINSIMSAWSGKHTMTLSDPTHAPYTARVQINVMTISDPSKAHNKVTAQKVPRGAPRFRSFVSGDTSTFDSRDGTETEAFTVRDRLFIRQIGTFDTGSAELNSSVTASLQSVEGELRRRRIAPGVQADGSDYRVVIVGRANTPGAPGLNQQVGQQRADAVKNYLVSALGWGAGVEVMAGSTGETHSTEEEAFKRVELSISNKAERTTQFNTAAHEAGHMFGLGDEYVDHDVEGHDQEFADQPTHYGDVQAHLGTDAANEGLVQNSSSIMSQGGQVNRGHYVYFLEALKRATGNQQWTVGS